MGTSFFPLIETLLVTLLIWIIYIMWTKIPSRQKQREEGELIITRRAIKTYDEVRGDFQYYFRKIFRLLILLSVAFFIVNVLIALTINIFIMNNPSDPVLVKIPNQSLLQLPPVVVSVIIAFMMCSAGWLMLISLFYHNRAIKLALETKYYDFFQENRE